MSSRTPTAAMLDLWTELDRLGVSEEQMPSARTLENWQQQGFIATERHWPGRPRGSSSRYADGTADAVVDLIEILESDRSFDRARLRLFWRGHHIEHARVLRGIDHMLEHILESIHEVRDKALQLARRRSRSKARRRLQAAFGESGAAVLATAIRQAAEVLTGEPIHPEDHQEIAVASGLPLEATARLTGSDFEAIADLVELEDVRPGIQELSSDDLEHGRAWIRELLGEESLKAGLGQPSDFPSVDEAWLAVLAGLVATWIRTYDQPL